MLCDLGLLHWIGVSDEGFFHISGLAKTQCTHGLGTNPKRDSTKWMTQQKSNSMLCCARQCCGRSLLLQQWNCQRNPLLSNAGHPHPVRRSTIPTECWLSELQSCWSCYTCGTSSLAWTFPKSLTESNGTSGWPARSTSLATTDVLLCRFVKNKMYWTYLPTLLQRKRIMTTASRNGKQEVLHKVWINLENQLHGVIRKWGAM